MSERNYFNLPENLVDILVQPLQETPTGKWKDFNRLYKLWRILDENSGSKELLLREDVPDEPDVDDYPDLDD